MGDVLVGLGKEFHDDDRADLRDIGFRSPDLSELALRIEDEIAVELNFDAAALRQVQRVRDVLDLLVELYGQ